MDLRTKEALMEKYWAGESSPSEEAKLRSLAQSDPALFSDEESQLLLSLNAFQNLSLEEGFFGEKLDEVIAAENHSTSGKLVRMKWWKQPLFGIAASLLLLVGVFFGTQMSANRTVQDLSAEEQAAYQDTKRALLLMSEKMSKVKSFTTALGKFSDTQIKIRQTGVSISN